MNFQTWASVGCLNLPSFFCAKACHAIDLEKSLHTNILCNLGFNGRYINTLAGILYSSKLFLLSSEVFLLSTTFHCKVPQVLQNSNFSFSAQNSIQSFGQAWISRPKSLIIFFAWLKVAGMLTLGKTSFINSSKSVNADPLKPWIHFSW